MDKKKALGIFGVDGQPLDSNRGKQTLYGMTIAFFRGDGGPGIIEQPQKLSKGEYDDLHLALTKAKTFDDVLLKTLNKMHKQGSQDQFSLTTSMLVNHKSARIAYIQLEKFDDSGEGIIHTPASVEFFTPKMKIAKGFEGSWNDPLKKD
ncbi:MAG TPA: hypothetical protein VMW20_04280 [Candidatus Nanoarchaeia archaeon]|nr:hypothetical protein [Candidatus Nanoarchaeia archaeon]